MTSKFKLSQWAGIPASVGLHWNTIVYLTGGGKPIGTHRLTGINIKFTESEVLIIVKKDAREQAMVAFFSATEFTMALWAAAQGFTSNSVKWRADEWEMRRRRKQT